MKLPVMGTSHDLLTACTSQYVHETQKYLSARWIMLAPKF